MKNNEKIEIGIAILLFLISLFAFFEQSTLNGEALKMALIGMLKAV